MAARKRSSGIYELFGGGLSEYGDPGQNPVGVHWGLFTVAAVAAAIVPVATSLIVGFVAEGLSSVADELDD